MTEIGKGESAERFLREHRETRIPVLLEDLKGSEVISALVRRSMFEDLLDILDREVLGLFLEETETSLDGHEGTSRDRTKVVLVLVVLDQCDARREFFSLVLGWDRRRGTRR